MLAVIQCFDNKILGNRCATDKLNQHMDIRIASHIKDIARISRTQGIHLWLGCSRRDVNKFYRAAHTITQYIATLGQQGDHTLTHSTEPTDTNFYYLRCHSAFQSLGSPARNTFLMPLSA